MMGAKTYMYAGIVVIILLSGFSMLLGNPVLTFNIISWGSILVIVPSILISYINYKRIREIEDQMSTFLRDLAESLHSGLSLIESIKKVSRNNYGALNSELKRVVNAINWGIDLENALERMRKRLKRSDKIDKILSIIMQTNRSGGEMYKIIFSLSKDIQKLKEIEDEKHTLLFRHVIMIYAIYLIFIVITIMLIKFLMPIIASTDQNFGIGMIQFGKDPCEMAAPGTVSSFACDIFKGTTAVAGFEASSGVVAYYKGLMFWMIIVQGIFSGFVAGYIESTSPENALKHSSILTLVGFLIYYLANITGII